MSIEPFIIDELKKKEKEKQKDIQIPLYIEENDDFITPSYKEDPKKQEDKENDFEIKVSL